MHCQWPMANGQWPMALGINLDSYYVCFTTFIYFGVQKEIISRFLVHFLKIEEIIKNRRRTQTQIKDKNIYENMKLS